ncbi:MAG: DDE-type integrase/transposase/recombinase [Candidatus Woesearchaeota archaeon]
MIKIKCVHCGKSNYIKKGFRKTENRDKIQVYKCLECNRKFTNDEGFYRMRNSEKKITCAIDLYFSNLSSRKVRNHFRRHWEHNASHVTVLDWARRYTLKVQKYVNTLKPQLSGKIYADETEIQRSRKDKRNDIFWCSVDWDTRYINATLYSPNPQNMKDGVEFMRKIRRSHLPKYIQTDALPLYPRAFSKVFGCGVHKKNDCQHIVNNVQKTGRHNVRIETVFMKIKDRVDDFRGLKALWSAPILMNGIVLQHNWIENHTTTNQIPCDLAGMKQETGQNRWLGMIKRSIY